MSRAKPPVRPDGMDGLGRSLALCAIRAYQRYLSPYKGFVCAFRVHTGRDSCSAYGCRVIGRYGLLAGCSLLRRRLKDCGEQHRRHSRARPALALNRQAGFCDLSCDLPGDLPCSGDSGGKTLGCVCDALTSGCDFDFRKRNREGQGGSG